MCTQQMRHTAQTSRMKKSVNKMEHLKEIMSKIRNCEELYTIVSACTNMPYVYCNPETYDDEVFIYFDKTEANKGAKWLLEAGNPISLAKVDIKSRLAFFTSLFPMGVNAVCADKGLDGEVTFQLNHLVRRQEPEKMLKGQIRVENSELHLTALYFAQELRKRPDHKVMPEELKGLDEEIAAHFMKGTYIVAVEEGKGLPVLQKKGITYQPVFTDIREFHKFNQEKKFRAAVVEYEKIREIMAPGTEGVTVNPFGANIMLKLRS